MPYNHEEETSPGVSVIIPHFEASETLGRAVSSVLAQSYAPLEIIIVDDASNRDTRIWLRQYVSNLSASIPIILLQLEGNSGPGFARNVGWERARGKWLAFLDADDTWSPQKLERQIECLMRDPSLRMLGNPAKIVRIGVAPSAIQRHTSTRRLRARAMLFKNPYHTSSVIIDSEIEDRFPTNQRGAEDYSLWARVAWSGHAAAVAEQPLSYLHKEAYLSGEGLSSNALAMQAGELRVFRALHADGHIGNLLLAAACTVSLTKFLRRLIVMGVRSALKVGQEMTRRTRPRIAVMGFYGMGNFGDDLFCVALSQTVKALRPDVQLTFLAPSLPGLEDECLKLPRIVATAWRRGGLSSVLLRAFCKVQVSVRADGIVWAGGSTLSRVRGFRAILARLDRVREKPTFALGVSVGPFPSDIERRKVANYIRGFRGLVVRDRASLLECQEMSAAASFGGDLSALYAWSDAAPKGRGGFIGFAPCRSALASDEELTAVVQSLCDLSVRSLAPGIRVFAINTHPELGDVALAERAQAEIAKRGLEVELHTYREGDVAGVWSAIAPLSLLVSSRLHGGLVAYLSRVPFVLGEYHRKCTDFLDDIHQPPFLRARDSAEIASVIDRIGDLSTLPGARLDPEKYRAVTRHEAARLLDLLPRDYGREAESH